MLLSAVAAAAQPTLEECRRLAREHYPEIRRYDLIRLAREYTLSNARRAYLPQFALSAQATWQTAVASYPDVLREMLVRQGIELPGLNKDQYKVALELNQTVWDGGKTAADKRIAEADAAQRARAADVALYEVEGRVDELYFGILLLDQRIVQTNHTLGLLRSNLEKMRSLRRNGAATQADCDAVEAELLAAGQQLAEVEASRGSYRRMLELFIGRELGRAHLVCPDAAEPAAGEPARPELALFDAKAEALAAQERSVKASVRPRFGLFAQGYYGYPGLDFLESMMKSDWSWNATVGVCMTWNFGAYYTKRNSLDKLRTARREVEVERDVFLFNTRLRSERESGEIARLRRALADDDRIVALRRSVRRAAEAKLDNGVIDTDDLLRRITEEAAAATARSAHEIELVKTICELRHTLNR